MQLAFRNSLIAFARNESGATLIIVGLAFMMLMAAIGTAVDIGRGQLMQAKLQNAIDAAGLAAGSAINSTDIQAEIEKYVNLNFAQNLHGTTVTSLTHTVSEDNMILTVTANARVPTAFMQVFGQEWMDISATTEITRSNKGLELVLVLDTTGSMAGSKLTALKNASNDLVNILFGEGKTTAENLWIGLVPFSQAVNIGTSHSDWIDSAHFATLDWGSTSWAGCVEARYTGRDITDDTPSDEILHAYHWADHNSYNNWIRTSTDTANSNTSSSQRICTSSSTCRCSNYDCSCETTGTTSDTVGNVTTNTRTEQCVSCSGSGSSRNCDRTTTVYTTTITTNTNYVINDESGPNKYCPTEVTRLTNVRGDIEAGISALSARGATHIPTGAVWGWRMLSPRWRGLWGGIMDTNNLPLNYDEDMMIKAAIIMTDGENTMYNNADGAYDYLNQNRLGTTNSGTATTVLNNKVTSICNAMKAQGIIVYTIVFDLNSTGVATMMRNCATEPDYYFDSPDANTLRQAFRTIGDSLANLRISQ